IAQEAQPATQPNTPTLPETRVEATPPLNPAYFDDGSPPLTGTILDGTLLTNQPIIGYRAPTSTSSTIIAVPDADLPATGNTIASDLIRDQIDLSFTDIARNAPGVIAAGPSDGIFADQIFIRGQQIISRNYRKDGFLDPTFVPRDLQNAERVEILKGPSSFL